MRVWKKSSSLSISKIIFSKTSIGPGSKLELKKKLDPNQIERNNNNDTSLIEALVNIEDILLRPESSWS